MSTKQLNIRLPEYAHKKLVNLRQRMGATYVQVITVALDALEEKRRGYNGWSNYESWLVALWLDNDYGTYHHILYLVEQFQGSDKLTREHPAIGKLADAIQEFVADQNPLGDKADMFTDLLNGALREVNWIEVAVHFIDG